MPLLLAGLKEEVPFGIGRIPVRSISLGAIPVRRMSLRMGSRVLLRSTSLKTEVGMPSRLEVFLSFFKAAWYSSLEKGSVSIGRGLSTTYNLQRKMLRLQERDRNWRLCF